MAIAPPGVVPRNLRPTSQEICPGCAEGVTPRESGVASRRVPPRPMVMIGRADGICSCAAAAPPIQGTRISVAASSSETIVLVVGHGSRQQSANADFEALVEAYRRRRPDLDVRCAYIEIARPALAEALAELGHAACRQVVVLPLFLFRAGHVKNDIPLALAAARRVFPATRFLAAEPLGVHPLLGQLLGQRAERLGVPPRAAAAAAVDPKDEAAAAQAKKTAVIVVGRGSSDPDANSDFCKLVRLFAEASGLTWVLPAFISITGPSLDDALELVARSRPERLLVIPYYLFKGVLVDRIAATAARFAAARPWIKLHMGDVIDVDPRLFELLDLRLAEALEGRLPLPCDNCQYRAPLPAPAQQIHGLRAMLWSIRHSYTHAQAVPHVHAHRPVKKHVLVCGNADCGDRGSLQLIEALRRLVKAAGLELTVRVTRTSCMGRCGEGPTVAVYPDGIWYRGLTADNAQELLEEHLMNDRLVARLVDNIMQ